MSLYVADSNFFIQAHRASYPLDVATGFWVKVKELADRGALISIDKVRDELYGRGDDLENWCKANLPSGFFHPTAGVMSHYTHVVQWAHSRGGHYTAQALNDFMALDRADAFLVAFAMESLPDRVLVTYEVSQPGRKSSIKIPEACTAHGVVFCNPMEMFRRLGETF